MWHTACFASESPAASSAALLPELIAEELAACARRSPHLADRVPAGLLFVFLSAVSTMQ